ncbi:tetraspanin 35 [Periophthalmus magnuspinnatus]|uniref:tetraspanin 35 n=1 Tax=Periophthalmus magnuspinnatus TaxID=409849 RepID=UPI0024373971|nr:tetraspanin 35 [Periophthalmus magnuspinnatus]
MSCASCLKFLMFFFNGIIFLAGAGILAVGIWVKVDSGSIFTFLEKIPDAPSELGQVLNVGYLLIVLGGLLLIIGFLGCCGAMRESKCMLLLFFIIVMLILLAEVSGAIVLLVFRPLVDSLFVKFGHVAVQNIKTDYGKNSDITGLWDTIMSTLKCCGYNNYTDFTNSSYHLEKGYPPMCCQDSGAPCGNSSNSTGVPTVPGCFSRIKALIDDNSVVIIGVALAIAALELGAMVTSMSLFCKIKSA